MKKPVLLPLGWRIYLNVQGNEYMFLVVLAACGLKNFKMEGGVKLKLL